jgi:hypothetical protein
MPFSIHAFPFRSGSLRLCSRLAHNGLLKLPCYAARDASLRKLSIPSTHTGEDHEKRMGR